MCGFSSYLVWSCLVFFRPFTEDLALSGPPLTYSKVGFEAGLWLYAPGLFRLFAPHDHNSQCIGSCNYKKIISILVSLPKKNFATSMTPLLPQTVAQPTKWRFLPKNWSQLVIFVIGLAFTWSRVHKNRAQFQITNYFKKWSYHKIVLLYNLNLY